MRLQLFLISFFFVLKVSGQHYSLNGDEYYKNENYQSAAIAFKKDFVKTSDSLLLKKIGDSYLESDNNRLKAIKYYKSYLKFKPKDKDIWLKLSKTYLYQYDIEKAKICLNEYISLARNKKKKIMREFEHLSSFELHYVNPKNISIVNVGKTVNTSANETFPIIDPKHKFLIFESNKLKSKGRIQLNGQLNKDLYISRFNGTSFGTTRPIKKLNSNDPEEIRGYSENIKTIYYNSKNPITKFYAIKKGLSYKKKGLNKFFNYLKDLEIHSMYETSTSDMTFISAKQKGKKHHYQLYMLKKLPNKKWSSAVSIPITNKKYNYINPFFHSPTNTLYFSSNLDNGLGGYDLYSTIFHSETNQWDAIENLGYPINSPYDEKNLCLTNDGSTGFISTQREGGFGKYDIYKISFLNEPVRRVIYLADFINPNDNKPYRGLNLEVHDENKNVIGKYLPNEQTGTFTIILEMGNYEIVGIIEDEVIFIKKITVSEFDLQAELKKIKL